MSTTQIAVRLPDELLSAVDALVAAGQAANRADAVRSALESHVAATTRRRLDAEIVAGYERVPVGAGDVWGAIDRLADWGTAASLAEFDDDIDKW